ncbi:MAG: hypothetical protein PWQ57_899 [Desulfovibrionales bacterium]|nr:hypothetical protein [Desulfovibrionales bacterium]
MPEARITRLKGQDAQAALDLVDQIQEERATRELTPDEVPSVLLSYQAAWHEDNSPVRVCRKSRRVGFSWGALAAESSLEAAAIAGQDQFYMGYNQSMAAEFIGDVVFFSRAYGLVVSAISVWAETDVIENERRDITIYKVRFASGHKVEALSSAPHNWRSRQGHAIIDEAAFHENLKEVVKGALAFLMWGGRVSLVSTYNGEQNDFAEFVRDILAGKLPWSLHTVTFDDALRAGFYRRVCLVRGKPWSPEAEEAYRRSVYAVYPTPDDAAEELDCIPKRGSGVYFSRLLIEHCQDSTIPVLHFERPAEWVLDPNRLVEAEKWCCDVLKPVLDALPSDRRTAVGQDFGRDGDLSIIKTLQEETRERWRTAFDLEMRKIPFDVQQLILFFILDRLPLFHHIKLDARGNGQSHAEACLQKYGPAHVECVMLTAAWYALWFPRYRRAYEDSSIIVQASEDFIADHRLVVLSKGQPKMSDVRVKGSDGQYRHGDSAVAGVLSWAAACEEARGPAWDKPVTAGRSVTSTMFRGYRL